MTNTNSSYMEKIVNPNLALAALNCLEPYGEFKALIKTVTETELPSCFKSVEFYAPGLLKPYIPCSQIERAAADTNVISIELREHIA